MPLSQRRGLHQIAVDELGRSIVTGKLAPESLLDPVEMETDFGVSRTVIRDALRVLAEKGLVEARPKRGTWVRPRAEWNLLDADVLRWQHQERPDEQFFADLAEVRAIIEPAGAALAALRRNDDDIAAIRTAAQDLMASDVHSSEAVHADVAFHRALLYAAHNELLQRMELVIETALRARNEVVHARRQTKGWADVVAKHLAVLDAVEARDDKAAEERMGVLVEQARVDAAGLADRRKRARKNGT
jgi:DNA-binding FadR family transcriptional regulator